MRYVMGVLMLCVVLGAATPTPIGGWAVVTFVDVPEYLEVGAATTLSFKIRQHGDMVVTDRSPALLIPGDDPGFVARMLRRDPRRIPARRTSVDGVYSATITPESAGELRITVDTDLYGWEVELLPFRVIAADARPPVMASEDRGRQLFSTQGCVTCHAKRDDPVMASLNGFELGPDLSGRTFPDLYVANKLRNPAQGRTDNSNWVLMPRLELTEAEVQALATYINGTTHTSPQMTAAHPGGR